MRFLIAAMCAGLLLAQRGPIDDAWDLVAKGDRAGATRILEQILKAKPSDGHARLLLGSILAEEGKTAEALAQLTEAARVMPESPMAHNALGEAYSSSGALKPAREAFRKAVVLDPNFAQAHANLGSALIKLGASSEAAPHLDRAIRIMGQTPDAAYPLYLRAKIFIEQGDSQKASAALQQAVTLEPAFGEAWSDLGQARKDLLDDAGAFQAFQRSVQVSPDNAISQYRLGAEYLRQGKAHEAVQHLQISFRLDPENQSMLYSLQLALRQDGQLEEAGRVKDKLKDVLRKIDKESQDAFVALRLNNQGAEIQKAGDLKAALEKYRAARMLDPTHPGIRMNFGIALLRTGQWKDGLSELREALRLDPDNAQVKTALKDALRQAPPEFGGAGKKPAVN